MSDTQLHLTIVTQDKELLKADVTSLTVPTTEGEITVLPGHIALFSRLQMGELVYRIKNEEHSLVISKGFIDVGANNTVMVIVDSAVHAREISVEKAESAMKAAHETMSQTRNEQELMMAEASLKQALLEMKVAQKTKRSQM